MSKWSRKPIEQILATQPGLKEVMSKPTDPTILDEYTTVSFRVESFANERQPQVWVPTIAETNRFDAAKANRWALERTYPNTKFRIAKIETRTIVRRTEVIE